LRPAFESGDLEGLAWPGSARHFAPDA